MSQSPPGFSEPTFPPPGWGPNAQNLNSMPHFLEGQTWVSFDRMHYWNGSAWMPGPAPLTSQQAMPYRPPAPPGAVGPFAIIVALIGLVLFALFALSICQSAPQPPAP